MEDLRDHGPSKPSEIARRTGSTSSQVLCALHVLMGRGWASSEFVDGRGTLYSASEGWEAAMDAWRPPFARWEDLRAYIAQQGAVTLGQAAAFTGTSASSTHKMIRRRVWTGEVREVRRPGRRVAYTLTQTAYEEAPGMGDEKKDKSKEKKWPPNTSPEAEDCEMDERNEP